MTLYCYGYDQEKGKEVRWQDIFWRRLSGGYIAAGDGDTAAEECWERVKIVEEESWKIVEEDCRGIATEHCHLITDIKLYQAYKNHAVSNELIKKGGR